MDRPLSPLTYRRVWTLAWPMIVSSASTPILGLVDTAVIGHLGAAVYLGAIALGALIFNFIYWGLGFLRMGTTGLTAQAHGAGSELEVRLALARAAGLGIAIGLVLVLVQGPLGHAAFSVIGGSMQVEALARDYYAIRIWGAPATLVTYAVVGWFIGLQRTRLALAVQIGLNGLNIALDLLFVIGFGWGVAGVALGTLIAEVTTAVGALLLALGVGGTVPRAAWRRALEPAALRRLLSVNGDIFIRTVCLVLAFAWFTAQGARFGDVLLAANFVLLQFFSFAAFFLDGFAYATESLVGHAVGARLKTRLGQAVSLSTQWAGGAAVGLTLVLALAGPLFIDALTSVPEVREAARAFLPWAALNPVIAVWCFQLDGIFIGATRTADMRNMMIVSLAIYLAAWAVLTPLFGNHGLWAAFTLFFAVRGVTLGARYPALARAAV